MDEPNCLCIPWIDSTIVSRELRALTPCSPGFPDPPTSPVCFVCAEEAGVGRRKGRDETVGGGGWVEGGQARYSNEWRTWIFWVVKEIETEVVQYSGVKIKNYIGSKINAQCAQLQSWNLEICFCFGHARCSGALFQVAVHLSAAFFSSEDCDA